MDRRTRGAATRVRELVGDLRTVDSLDISMLAVANRESRTAESRRRLVSEVAHACEDHRDPGIVRGGDHFVIADGAARLNNRGSSSFYRGQ